MIRVNLLHPEKKTFRSEGRASMQEAEPKKKVAFTKGTIFLAIILIAGLFYLQRNSLNKEKGLLSIAQQEKEKLIYVFSKLEELEQQKALYEQKINLIKQLKSAQDVPVKVMDGLSEYVPSWVWLTQSTFDNSMVSIKGMALSNSSIADFISQLEISPYFNDVNLIASIQKRIKNSDVHEFSLTARYLNSNTADSQSEPAVNSTQGK